MRSRWWRGCAFLAIRSKCTNDPISPPQIPVTLFAHVVEHPTGG